MEILKGLRPEEETSEWIKTQQHASRDMDVQYGLSTVHLKPHIFP